VYPLGLLCLSDIPKFVVNGPHKAIVSIDYETNSLLPRRLSHSTLSCKSADNAFIYRSGNLSLRRAIFSTQRLSSVGLLSLLYATA